MTTFSFHLLVFEIVRLESRIEGSYGCCCIDNCFIQVHVHDEKLKNAHQIPCVHLKTCRWTHFYEMNCQAKYAFILQI